MLDEFIEKLDQLEGQVDGEWTRVLTDRFDREIKQLCEDPFFKLICHACDHYRKRKGV